MEKYKYGTTGNLNIPAGNKNGILISELAPLAMSTSTDILVIRTSISQGYETYTAKGEIIHEKTKNYKNYDALIMTHHGHAMPIVEPTTAAFIV